MKNLKFKIPDFIKELIILLGIFIVVSFLNLFIGIYPPILYASFLIDQYLLKLILPYNRC